MKIRQLEIVGFGKWQQTTITLDENYQLFYGSNETGKSTLYQFIQTILFGFPPKRERDFAPWDGAAYGGRLKIDHPVHGEVVIERFKNKQKGQAIVTLYDSATGGEELLQKILSPLNRELFTEVFTLRQEQTGSLHQLSGEHLQKFLLTAGLSGSQQLLAVKQQYLLDSQKLYKPKGRQPLLNQKIQELNELGKKIAAKEQQAQHCQKAETIQQQALVKRNLVQEQLSAIQKQLNQLDQQIELWDLYAEYQQLNQQLASASATDVAQVEMEQFRQTYQQYVFLQQEAQRLQKLQNEKLGELDDQELTFFQQHEFKLKTLISQQADLQRILTEQKWLQQNLTRIQQESERLTVRHQWDFNTLPVQPSAEKMHAIEQDYQQEMNLIEQQQGVLNKIKDCQQVQAQLEDQLQDLETQQELFASQTTTRSSVDHFSKTIFKPFGLGSVFLLVGIFGMILSFILPTYVQWIVRTMGCLLLLVGVYGLVKNKQLVEHHHDITAEPDPIVQDQWRQCLSELDWLADQDYQLENQLAEIVIELEQLADKQKRLNRQYHAPAEMTFYDWLESYDELVRAHQLYAEQQHTQTQLDQLAHEIDQFTSEAAVFQAHFAAENIELPEFLQQLDLYCQKMQQKKNWLTHDQPVTNAWAVTLQEVASQMQEVELTLRPFMHKYKLQKVEEIPDFLDQQQALETSVMRLANLRKTVKPFFDEDFHYTLAAIKQAYEQNQTEFEQLTKELQLLQEQIQRSDLIVQQQMQDSTLDQMYQSESGYQDEIRQMAVDWAAKRLAARMIDDVLYHLSDYQLPQLLRQAGEFMRILTQNKYASFCFAEDILLIEQSDGRKIPLQQLSTGTRDQLYLAIRLAFVTLHRQACYCPVIIDDGWLHYDKKRKANLALLLGELSQRVQVICFTSDQEMTACLSNSGAVVKSFDKGDHDEKIT